MKMKRKNRINKELPYINEPFSCFFVVSAVIKSQNEFRPFPPGQTALSEIKKKKNSFDNPFNKPSLYITNMSRLDILTTWFTDNKIVWDKEALEIKETNGSFGIFAKKNMKKDSSSK